MVVNGSKKKLRTWFNIVWQRAVTYSPEMNSKSILTRRLVKIPGCFLQCICFLQLLKFM